MLKKKMSSGEEQIGLIYYWWIVVRIWARKNIVQRFRDYRARRPHRSFKLTRRRDYVRPLEIGGYWRFAKNIFDFIFENKRLFFRLIFLTSLFNLVLVGLLDQEFLDSLQTVADSTNEGIFSGGWGEIGKAGLVIVSTFSTGGLSRDPNEAQQIIMAAIVGFAWLAVVQICRNIFAGARKISVRDVLYTCGAPIIPLVVVFLVVMIQAVPALVGILISSAAQLTEFAGAGVEKLAFTSVVFLLFSLSIYWIMGSIFAGIIVTNQGGGRVIYPFQALKVAGDMVSQRRLFLFRRILFCVFVMGVLWILILLPLILFINWISSVNGFFSNIPVVQLAMVVLTAFSVVYFACYLYTLYRKIIDYDRKN